MDGTSFPLRSDSITKRNCCIHKYAKMFSWGLPHELIPYTYCMFLLYILLRLPSGIGYQLDRRRQGLLALQQGDTRFGRRWDDVCFRSGLHSIRRLGDILLAHTFSRIRIVSLHHPLRGDLLCHHLCAWQQALPERMDGV